MQFGENWRARGEARVDSVCMLEPGYPPPALSVNVHGNMGDRESSWVRTGIMGGNAREAIPPCSTVSTVRASSIFAHSARPRVTCAVTRGAPTCPHEGIPSCWAR